MRWIPLLLTAVLAGCFGVPEGAQMGDTVTIDWVAYDANGDVVREGSNANFVIGSGESRLGMLLETSVIGKGVEETYRFQSDDPSRDYKARFTPERLQTLPAIQEVPIGAYQQAYGEPTVGDIQQLDDQISLRVEAIEGNALTFRYLINGTVTLPDPDFGAIQNIHAHGDLVHIEFDIQEESTFVLRPGFPGRFEGMEPGSYKAIGVEGDHLVYRYTPVVDPALIGNELEFEVTVKTIVAGAQVTPDGAYGGRDSPQLLARPS